MLAPLTLILTEPEYEPAARLPGLTETVTDLGIVPLVGLTSSQLPPDVVDAVAEKFRIEPSLVARFKLCPPGLLLPVWQENDNELGLATIPTEDEILRVTGIERGLLLAPLTLTLIEPE